MIIIIIIRSQWPIQRVYKRKVTDIQVTAKDVKLRLTMQY